MEYEVQAVINALALSAASNQRARFKEIIIDFLLETDEDIYNDRDWVLDILRFGCKGYENMSTTDLISEIKERELFYTSPREENEIEIEILFQKLYKFAASL